MENQEPRKFRLRRIQPFQPQINVDTDESIIEKNLEPLKQNVEKKKRAQEIYYENHSDLIGESPLLRGLGKKPVKQRLGRRIPFTGTNTSAIPPKFRLRRLNTTQNNLITRRKSRNFSVQHRLNIHKVGQHGLLTQNGIKKFKLRRMLPGSLGTPKNFKVQIRNNNMVADKQRFMGNVKRFKQILNVEIQCEIKQLQMVYRRGETMVPTPVIPSTTEMSMNERFGLLS